MTPEDYAFARGREQGYLEGSKAGVELALEFQRRSVRPMYIVPPPPESEVVDALRAIIYASDGCRGHLGCNHSMEPWQKARALLERYDGGPYDEGAL